ncbi:MAG: phenylalanine--tRNA ligase subunit beta [Armatimonadetes bacterium]|nr:phenylalanine--tRNA ligase subunit beta [Armatimonadota bacterium]
MKLTVEWLKEFVRTDAAADEIGHTLTMLGMELERMEESPLGPVLDFKVTPNRGDCLSVLGVARELCAKDAARYRPTDLMRECVNGFALGDEEETAVGAGVEVLDPDLCPRYGARLFRGLAPAQSSERIQGRLLACGMRPINVIVDMTNYVMLELGQPLHAFDLDLLAGSKVVVRRPRPGETLKTLDGIERKLGPDMLMICDADRPVAVAGVMGGEDSEVSGSTKNLLLESAHFDPRSIRRTRKALGLSTDASYRFERYVDPEGVVRALNRFALLVRKDTGTEPVNGVLDVYARPPERKPAKVRPSRWNLVLGVEVPEAAAATGLQALGCRVTEENGSLVATPPSWRADLRREDDFVEEIGRLWGYEKIPESLPIGSTLQGGETPEPALTSRVKRAMLRLGFTEVINHTFGDLSPLDADGERVRLRNPVAPESALLRCSLLPGLAACAARNRGRPLFLFEAGKVFLNGREFPALGFLMSGRLLEEHWENKESPAADLAAAKGMVDLLGELLRRPFEFQANDDKRFHRHRQAKVLAGGRELGLFGQVLPEVADGLHVREDAMMGELDLEAILSVPEATPRYRPISPFPAIRRDMAMAISSKVPYSELESAVREAAGETLERIWLFDVYEGEGIEQGKHSLGIAMLLRHPERTLTDEEANDVRERAFRALEALGATRR